MPAFARQMPVLAKFVGRPAEIERHAQLRQPVDRLGACSMTNSTVARLLRPRARHHRVFDMAFKGVAGFEHRRNPALRPCRGAIGQRTFGQHGDLVLLRQLQRCCQPCSTRSDDENVGFHQFTPRFRW
jgi:hypothetical protein